MIAKIRAKVAEAIRSLTCFLLGMSEALSVAILGSNEHSTVYTTSLSNLLSFSSGQVTKA